MSTSTSQHLKQSVLFVFYQQTRSVRHNTQPPHPPQWFGSHFPPANCPASTSRSTETKAISVCPESAVLLLWLQTDKYQGCLRHLGRVREHTSSVLADIGKCMGKVTTAKTITHAAEPEHWLKSRGAKCACALTIQEHFRLSDPKNLQKGITCNLLCLQEG